MSFRTAVAVAACLLVGLTGCGGDDDDYVPVTGPVEGEPEGTESFGDQSQTHTTDDQTYPETPPVGGVHDPTWQTCGVYDEPVRDENAVHSMEHGAVWIAYSPDLDPAEIATLEGKADGEDYVLVAPYTDLPSPVVLTAWAHQLAVDSADDPRVDEFLDVFVEGPQTPEPGVTCADGKM